ncbi:MAG: hypothetical protein PUD20_03005 [bacterium]|nr:hypothetical protein [bacterium]
MSEYQRFFSYIYAYENGQKKTNVGFAKIQIKGASSSIELHMRSISFTNTSAELYLVIRNDHHLDGLLLGEIPFVNGGTDRRFSWNNNDSSQMIPDITTAAGIAIVSDGKLSFLSQWDEATIDWNTFQPVSQAPDGKESADDFSETVSPSLPADDNQAADNSVEKTIHSAELNLSRDLSVNSSYHQEMFATWQETWEYLLANYPVLHPFSDESIRCVRMELKDLRRLPASNWHLCNNSFLLHSFLTYRHLIIGEIPRAKDHHWFVGIPGIQYRQEHVMAAVFGFMDFFPDKDSSSSENPFGYWYRPMDEED